MAMRPRSNSGSIAPFQAINFRGSEEDRINSPIDRITHNYHTRGTVRQPLIKIRSPGIMTALESRKIIQGVCKPRKLGLNFHYFVQVNVCADILSQKPSRLIGASTKSKVTQRREAIWAASYSLLNFSTFQVWTYLRSMRRYRPDVLECSAF